MAECCRHCAFCTSPAQYKINHWELHHPNLVSAICCNETIWTLGGSWGTISLLMGMSANTDMGWENLVLLSCVYAQYYNEWFLPTSPTLNFVELYLITHTFVFRSHSNGAAQSYKLNKRELSSRRRKYFNQGSCKILLNVCTISAAPTTGQIVS